MTRAPQDLRRITTIVESWFEQHQRPLPWRKDYDAYAVWVSEVMLQQTRMEVVLPYHQRFLERFPTVDALAAAAFHDVHALWSGLGYYRRARMLHAGAQYVVEQFGGAIPPAADELRKIPGVGRYTSGAIASIAFEEPAAIVDGNVTRLLARVFAFDDPIGSGALERAVWERSAELVATARSPRNFNQGLMELGATICTPRNAACIRCPLREHCDAFAKDLVHALPTARARQATIELAIPLYLVTDGQGRVMLLRATGGLMAGMYHLPHGNALLLPSVAAEWQPLERVGSFRHTITNRRITFEVFTADPVAGQIADGAEAAWISMGELPRLPHPSYVRKALRLARSPVRSGAGRARP